MSGDDEPAGDLDFPRPFPHLRSYMDWRRFEVMPYAGGLRDQDPEMLDSWRLIYGYEAEWRKEKEKD